ncbi:emerin-like [Heteronotia binoei]|uniref:emerin-like n=1 Tax=Heteronotia binoei TaxID=13085 RepID=UPI002930F3E5|nr:emerin-like [Heteronotia binoei]
MDPLCCIMDEYSGLTDKELIARLKKYAIPHGPVVGTTRKLYEKKIYEYETERTKYPGRSEAHTEPRSSRSYTRETFVSPRSREDFNYGREALGSTKTYLEESYDSARNEEYADYGNEEPSHTKSYLSHDYSFPRHEGRYTYKTKDWEVNSSEGPTSSYRYESSIGGRSNLGGVSARQPISEPYLYSSSLGDVASERDSGSYQTVFHRKSSGPSSLGVEPRRAIRPELQAPKKDLGGDKGTKRYLPLWPQLLLFVLLAGFLAFTYYFLQGNADDNPFVKYLRQ